MPKATARQAALKALLTAMTVLGMVLAHPKPASAQPAGPTTEATSPAPAPGPGHRILLLYGEPRLTPAIVTQDAILRSILTDRSSVPVTFYTEYLDLNLFHGTVPLPELRELLRRKYETRHIDLIVTGGSRVLRIALHNRTDLFSSAPIVFLGVDPTAAADLRIEPDVTGTWLHMGWADTLAAARRLQPDVRRVVVVGGTSPTDRVWIEGARRQLTAPAHPIEVVYLTDLSLDEILTHVRGLARGTVVLVGVLLRDATGRDFSTPEAATRIAAAASVPVYALTEATVGTGIVGGHVSSFEAHGRVGAELALQMLAGERPPPTNMGTSVPMFDARQIERWGLDFGRLPTGSVVRFREPSLWERHRVIVLSALGALLLQGGLIGGLLVQRAQRRRAQQSLAERLRFETLLSDLAARFAASASAESEATIHRGLQLIGESFGVDWATVRTLDERSDEARVAQAWTRNGVPSRPAAIRTAQTPWITAQLRQDHVVHLARPADLPDEAVIDRQTLQGLGTGSMVVVPLRGYGTVLGCLVIGTAREGRGWSDLLTGRLRLLGEVFAHALERQRAVVAALESNAQIRDLAGRLMSAQEEERRRIARDLHDDANQELAALSIALSALGGRLPPDSAPGLREEVARLQGRAVALAEGIRHLSHELHPGVLQHVGVAVALRSYCREFTRTHGLPVTFRAEGDLESVPADVALCLYRVVQEALGNVAKHAAASEAHVTVERAGPDVVLAITDNGSGFDQASARSRRGLGLLSLDERARLVGGRFSISSKPQRGTELRIVVPIIEAEDAARDRIAG
jgi:signal transduction histidine kinase